MKEIGYLAAQLLMWPMIIFAMAMIMVVVACLYQISKYVPVILQDTPSMIAVTLVALYFAIQWSGT